MHLQNQQATPVILYTLHTEDPKFSPQALLETQDSHGKSINNMEFFISPPHLKVNRTSACYWGEKLVSSCLQIKFGPSKTDCLLQHKNKIYIWRFHSHCSFLHNLLTLNNQNLEISVFMKNLLGALQITFLRLLSLCNWKQIHLTL